MKSMSIATPAGAGAAREFVDRRIYEYHGVQLHCALATRGVLRRVLLIHTPQLRALLGVPQRQQIEPLQCVQAQFELRTSELWEQSDHLALPRLQRVYTEAQTVRALAAAEQAARRAQRRRLGRPILPLDNPNEARGILLHAGDSAQGYQLYLWEPQALQLMRVAHPALREALRASRARPGETIQLRRQALPGTPLEEERSGPHGEERRTVIHHADRYEVVRVPAPAVIRDEPYVA